MLLFRWTVYATAYSLGTDDTTRVDPQGFFRDALGRVRIFHGMNVVYKEIPWVPADGEFDFRYGLNDHDIDLMREWGFNVVRLGVMWPGVEPAPGVRDDGYLNALTKITQRLSSRGIHTFLDLHQDLLSRRFCGEGVPEHYVDALLANSSSQVSQARAFPFPAEGIKKLPMNDTGYPNMSDCLSVGNFATFYMSEKVGALFNDLYSPDGIIHAGFLKYWSWVAEHFSSAGSEILGYELLNEPSTMCLDGVSTCVRPSLLGNHLENTYLLPLYRAAGKKIRNFDKDRPIFFEAGIYPKMTDDIFSELPLLNDSQQVFAYHTYCNPGKGIIHQNACYAMQDNYLRHNMGFRARNKGLGGFMTEFGAVSDQAHDIRRINRLLGQVDEYYQSWAYWSLKDFHDFTTMDHSGPLYNETGNIEMAKLKMLSRTYAPAIAGTPSRMFFDPDTAEFTLRYMAQDCAGAPTEIYVNQKLHYPKGHQVIVFADASESVPKGTPCATVTYPEVNRIHIKVSERCIGRTIDVKILHRATFAEVMV